LLVTIHSERLTKYGFLKKKTALFLLKHSRFFKLITVSHTVKKLLDKHGIASEYIPAYVPPSESETVRLPGNKRKRFLFSMWKVTRPLAENVYGLPLALEFLRQNKNRYLMTFMIGNKKQSDEKYLQKIIDRYGVRQDVEILYDQALEKYWDNFAFFLRANLHDGFPLSVREALDRNIPVIASDAGTRPEGVLIFRSGDLNDLQAKVSLVEQTPVEKLLSKKETTAYHTGIINLYFQALKNQKA
jgi:glycosyltransferase involved in cell wall biosynthesis